jgi:ankyrin repeat protein
VCSVVSEDDVAKLVMSARHDLNADCDVVDTLGRTPLHLALAAGRLGAHCDLRPCAADVADATLTSILFRSLFVSSSLQRLHALY